MMSSVINQESSKVPSSQRKLVLAYATFVTVAMLIFHFIAEHEFSAVLTLSGVFQCLAFCLLGVHALSTRSVQGISAKSLQLYAIALGCRLSSTTWLQGYLPDDKTGDYVYQIFDALSLAMILLLLFCVLKAQSKTYEAGDDALPATPFVLGSLVFAGLLHGDLDARPIFDTLWMCGLFVGTVAVVPQMWLMTRNGVNVPVVTSHFVAVMTLSCILSGIYMWHAHAEITCEKAWIEGFNHTGYAVLAAHVVHLIVLGSFAYLYVKNLATRGLRSHVCASLAGRTPLVKSFVKHLEISDPWVV